MTTHALRRLLAVLAASAALGAAAQALQPGQVRGSAVAHTAASALDVVANGALVLPAAATGSAPFAGRWRDAPRGEGGGRVPVVVFLHGSSGLALPAIAEWQRWLATQGIASFAPDSFALPGRVTYASPVDKDLYENVHALRASEIRLALDAVGAAAWADPARIVLAGTSEGATAVARHDGSRIAGRIVYAWSCEDNYFVRAHGTVARAGEPALNVISASDPFFSPSNSWLGNAGAAGHCGVAWKGNPQAAIVLLPGAPHTLINLPRAREATAGFLQAVFGR